MPDHISLWDLLLIIRKKFDQYVNLRPVKLLKGAPCPLKDVKREDIDMMFVRENSEGEYAGSGSWLFPGKPNEVVIQDGVFSRVGCERIIRYAYELARKYHCIAVLKDAATIVAQEGDLVYINQSGNDGMATGGSGDVLAGMITGLLGGGLAAHEAAVHGVYLHGLAGDHARCDLGAYSMIASDIITHIKDVTGGSYESVL